MKNEMTLTERFNCWKQTAELLQSTNSIVEKRIILNNVPNEMNGDIQYIFEILAGQHKFGFTYIKDLPDNECLPYWYQTKTIKEYLAPLNDCNLKNDWSTGAIISACQACRWFDDVVEPIVNRSLKLGIGRSVLPKDGLSAMTGKNFTDVKVLSPGPYYVTEKLDGNRCIARFDGMKWNFTSRNGKPMKVQFDMTGLPTEYIYDGEIMSKEQTQSSVKLTEIVRGVEGYKSAYTEQQFNNTSGLINSKYGDKSNLVYNIFDIMADDVPYCERRELLNVIHSSQLGTKHTDWRIVPVLMWATSATLTDVHTLLDTVTSYGAEGLMINAGNATYQHKRTNDLMKYKKVKTIDLRVVDIQMGNGKYDGMVGALECVGDFGDKFVTVQVGSGLSDDERLLWALKPENIIGKIVEIAYFSESQNKGTNGSIYYSLRFPRLKCVRTDKNDISKE